MCGKIPLSRLKLSKTHVAGTISGKGNVIRRAVVDGLTRITYLSNLGATKSAKSGRAGYAWGQRARKFCALNALNKAELAVWNVLRRYQVSSFSGQEVHKLAPRSKQKNAPYGAFLIFVTSPQEYIFNFKVLTCNSNKQQAVEDRVLDIISRFSSLLLTSRCITS